MNILFLTTHLNTGGITTYLLTLTKGLVRCGHRVSLISAGGNMESAFRKAGAHVRAINIRTKSELSPKIYSAIKPVVRFVCDDNIDVVHAQTRVTQVLGYFIAKRTKAAFVTTCHGYFKPRFSRKIFPCWGDAVIAISLPVKEHLMDDFQVPAQKIHLIESGIDLDVFHRSDDMHKRKQRQRFHLGEGPVIGIVARLSDVKGQDVLIKAMPEILLNIPGLTLVLVGQGKMEPVLRQLTKQLGLENNVRFFSEVNHTSELLDVMDIFVMPSRQEGLGISIMEAQASGIPVVASRVGGIPTIVQDGHTGILVEPENPHALAQAIIQLLQDPAKMECVGDNGRQFIERTHSAVSMVQQTESVYTKVYAQSNEANSCC